MDAPFLGNLALRASYRDNSKPTALLDTMVGEEYTHMVKAVKKSLQELGKEAG